MYGYTIFFIILTYFQLYSSHPFIFEDNLHICYYNSTDNGNTMKLNSKLWTVEDSQIIIYYTLCGRLPKEINCGLNAAICLKNKKYKSTHVIGKRFIKDNNTSSLRAIDGTTCQTSKKYKATVLFTCSHDAKETHLETINDCEYIIYMIDPECLIPCTTRTDDQLIDLRPLKGNYIIKSTERNFTIALCGAKPNCTGATNDVTACETSNHSMIPLSTFQNERLLYNRQKNEIVYRGSYKGPFGNKKFELLFKCDWENNLREIKHRSGNKFVMDTSYGCVKLPHDSHECMKIDSSLIYNLTQLYKPGGYSVVGVPKGNGSIHLNVCGPLNFNKQSRCSGSFSQVCQVSNGKYLNRGSTLSKFLIIYDAVKMTYSNGAKCEENPTKNYNTHIDFTCSKVEQGPVFDKTDDCDLFIKWNTPQACPLYNKLDCAYEQHENIDCSVNFGGETYELSPLKRYGGSYEVADQQNNNIKFFLNVCNPVKDDEAPCMKDSMIIMKNLEEKHVKYRVKSLGKMHQILVVDEQIVIKTTSGTYCGAEGDYSSSIHFVCSEKEELPRLVNNTRCTFFFQWKTPYACLNNSNTTEQCLITSSASDTALDFSKSKQTALKIHINETDYIFDICKNFYKECSGNGKCETIPVTKQLSSANGVRFLEVILPKECITEKAFNKVIYEFVCDIILNNEHFKIQDVGNCTLKFLMYTNLICDNQIYQTDNKRYEKYDTVDDTSQDQEKENCSVVNTVNNFKIDIDSLDFKIPIVDCPAVVFYEHNSSAVLIYPSTKICNASAKTVVYEYKAVLSCSKRNIREVKEMDCFELHHLAGPEYCKLFESTNPVITPTNNTAAIASSISGVGLFVVLVCVYYFWKRRSRKSFYDSIYEKDADM